MAIGYHAFGIENPLSNYLTNNAGSLGQLQRMHWSTILRLLANVAFLKIRAYGPALYLAQPEGLGIDQHNIQIKGLRPEHLL